MGFDNLVTLLLHISWDILLRWCSNQLSALADEPLCLVKLDKYADAGVFEGKENGFGSGVFMNIMDMEITMKGIVFLNQINQHFEKCC